MDTPIINIQEAHALTIPGTTLLQKDDYQRLLKPPYPVCALVYKPLTITDTPDDSFVCVLVEEKTDAITFTGAVFFPSLNYGTRLLDMSIPLAIMQGLDVVIDYSCHPDHLITAENVMNSAVLGLCLMNVKNIQYIEYDPNKGLSWRKQKKGKKKPKPPFIKYKILQINPLKQYQHEINRPDTEKENNKRLHAVRGHFKTFTAEHPLFGRLIGTYWWGDCVKGNPVFGLVAKDYELKISPDILMGMGVR